MVDSITRLMKLQQQNTETLTRQNEELKARLLKKDEQLRMTMEDNRMELEDIACQATARLRKLEEQAEAQAKRLSADVQEIRQTVTEIKEVKNAMNAVNMGALGGQITELQSKTAPVQIVMANYERHKRDNDRWYSDGFYTHPHGYKMCLNVDANGNGSGKGTHVSCFIHLMRGEFDNLLKWPFRGDVTITLLNQREDKNNHFETAHFNDQTLEECTARVTSGERAAKGYHKFIPLSELGYNPATNCQYLVNDCLYFRVKFELR